MMKGSIQEKIKIFLTISLVYLPGFHNFMGYQNQTQIQKKLLYNMKNKTYPLSFITLILLSVQITSSYAQNQFEVLLYTQDDFYHIDAITTAVNAFRQLAEKNQFGFSWSMDADIFTKEDMDKYAAVIFLNIDGDKFTDPQKAGLKKFINNGGGFIGLHGASTTKDKWPWYDQLVGRVFIDHPKLQTAVLKVVNKQFPATFHLPDRWIWSDEWYNFTEAKSDNLITILEVDENTYDPNLGWGDPIKGMGLHHPIAWYHTFDGGRSFYTATGHKKETYLDQRYMDYLYGALYWVATGRGILQ